MKNVKTLAVLNTMFFLLHLMPSQLTQLKLLNDQTIGGGGGFGCGAGIFQVWQSGAAEGVATQGFSIFGACASD